jgi:signal transduction histidine kinase
MTSDFLRRLPLFSSLSEEDLTRLCEMAEPLPIQAGQVLIREGSPGDAVYIIEEGEFEVTKRAGDQELIITRRGPGEVIGEMALLDGSARSATVRALGDSRVLRIAQDTFQEMLAYSPSARKAILQNVGGRLRSIESTLMQHEKMAALGGLAAGLAHELNNPSAAIRRNADHLRNSLDEWQEAIVGLQTVGLRDGQNDRLQALETEMIERSAQPVFLDPLVCSDLEIDLQAWLEERGVEGAWELAPALVALGWEVDSLRDKVEDFSTEQLSAVLQWLGTGSSIYRLLDEVRRSAERISEVVGAVKQYSYADQAPVQNVDVHQGLDSTLIILRHKLRAGVKVIRDYAPDLPYIEAYAGELNQVWTNLIDNAIDAMNGQGELLIRTCAEKGHVIVEITDNGPGIPPALLKRIFDPFFTTKPQGQGSGLGLYLAYNSVQKHFGQTQVESRPGRTCFQVTLPVELGYRP